MSYIGSTPTTQSFIAGTDYFNGTGSAVNFTLSRQVNSVNDIEVIVNNVEQIPSGYSVSGTTLTFSAAPSAGTSNVYVRYLSTTNLSLAIPAGTSASFNTVGATTLAVTGASTVGSIQTNGVATNLYPLVSGTAVASTSGTSIDFTGIPSWVKRITVMFSGVSTNGSSVPIIQLGDSGGVETSGYTGVSSELYTTISTVGNPSNGFGIQGGMAASLLLTGNITITLQGSNIWVATGAFYRVGAINMTVISCGKTLSDTLTQVRITTVNGTDTFDAGIINILYE